MDLTLKYLTPTSTHEQLKQAQNANAKADGYLFAPAASAHAARGSSF
jgi:hypothetical protein